MSDCTWTFQPEYDQVHLDFDGMQYWYCDEPLYKRMRLPWSEIAFWVVVDYWWTALMLLDYRMHPSSKRAQSSDSRQPVKEHQSCWFNVTSRITKCYFLSFRASIEEQWANWWESLFDNNVTWIRCKNISSFRSSTRVYYVCDEVHCISQ